MKSGVYLQKKGGYRRQIARSHLHNAARIKKTEDQDVADHFSIVVY